MPENCQRAVLVCGKPADEVYRLAADMGGMGFIHSAECAIMRNSALINIHIARFQNCCGPEGAWRGGREKAPAALCRKIAEAADGGEVEMWGDGSAVRSYTYVDDRTDGIVRLMRSDLEGAVNIGRPEYVSVNALAACIADVAGKKIAIRHIQGPVGVQSRNFSHARIGSVGWRSRFSLRDGIEKTCPRIAGQVRRVATSR